MPRDTVLTTRLHGVKAEFAEQLTRLEGSLWDVPRHQLEGACNESVRNLTSGIARVLSMSADRALVTHRLAYVTAKGLTYPRKLDEAAALAKSSTTVIQKLEGSESVYAELARLLISDVHSHASFTAYISDPGSQRLGMHVDKWDNIIIQLKGRKTFHFADGRRVELRPNDLLTIPQDVQHDVTTQESSLHLSIILLRRKWVDEQGWSRG